MGAKAERRAARERVSAYCPAQLAELLSHVAAAIDRYRDGEIDACTVDETIHHYHRAAGELWRFCFSRGGGSHAEFVAGLLDRMAAGAGTIDWWERATPRRRRARSCTSGSGTPRPSSVTRPASATPGRTPPVPFTINGVPHNQEVP